MFYYGMAFLNEKGGASQSGGDPTQEKNSGGSKKYTVSKNK
jgi:hypothetical protein